MNGIDNSELLALLGEDAELAYEDERKRDRVEDDILERMFLDEAEANGDDRGFGNFADGDNKEYADVRPYDADAERLGMPQYSASSLFTLVKSKKGNMTDFNRQLHQSPDARFTTAIEIISRTIADTFPEHAGNQGPLLTRVASLDPKYRRQRFNPLALAIAYNAVVSGEIDKRSFNAMANFADTLFISRVDLLRYARWWKINK